MSGFHSLPARAVLASALIAGLIACSAGFARSKPVVLPDPKLDLPSAKGEQVAVFAGGCFWGVEAVFDHVKGVREATSGYSGGVSGTAEYETVSTGSTGHAESVKVVYDPTQVSYGQLLKVYFSVAHDPTELNRQGPDEGPQYRSAIFYANDEQKQVAEAYIAQLNTAKVFKKPIATTVTPLQGFFVAEEYHQNFLRLHPTYPYIVYNDLPKLDALKREWPELLKKAPTK